MPERLLFCADNLFCDRLYSSHVLSADEEATNFEVWHLGTARRHFGDRWEPTTTNVDHWAKARCDVPRYADFCAIDRASNHKAKRFKLQNSGDDFTGIRTAWDITLPSVPGGAPAGGPGAITEEGAWIKTFAPELAYDWRLYSVAMGAGIVPQLTGVWLGKCWQPTDWLLELPTQDETIGVQFLETKSPFGWSGRTRYVRGRQGTLIIRPGNENDYDMIRWQVLTLFAGGYPAWLIHDAVDGGPKARLIACPTGELDFGRRRGIRREILIPFVEEQPL